MPRFRDVHHSRAQFLSVIQARTGSATIGSVLADGLRSSDAVRVLGAFPAARIAALQAEAERAHAGGRFAAARVGHALHATTAVRGDELCWLGASPHPQGCDGLVAPASAALLHDLDTLRVELDRALLLGTRAVEAQYARYAPGTRYTRHLDRFAASAHPQGCGDDASLGRGRVLSLVIYLNADWGAADGGMLRLYDGEGGAHDVPPLGGDLVAFLSDRVEHEVLPATRPRWSIAAWLTRTASATL